MSEFFGDRPKPITFFQYSSFDGDGNRVGLPLKSGCHTRIQEEQWYREHQDEQEVLDKMAMEFDREAMRELYIMIHPQGEEAEGCPLSR